MLSVNVTISSQPDVALGLECCKMTVTVMLTLPLTEPAPPRTSYQPPPVEVRSAQQLESFLYLGEAAMELPKSTSSAEASMRQMMGLLKMKDLFVSAAQ